MALESIFEYEACRDEKLEQYKRALFLIRDYNLYELDDKYINGVIDGVIGKEKK